MHKPQSGYDLLLLKPDHMGLSDQTQLAYNTGSEYMHAVGH